MKKIQTVVNRFERAVVSNSWKGGGNPNIIPAIEEEYKEAKRELFKMIEVLKCNSGKK